LAAFVLRPTNAFRGEHSAFGHITRRTEEDCWGELSIHWQPYESRA